MVRVDQGVLALILAAVQACWRALGFSRKWWVGGLSGLTSDGAVLAGARVEAFAPSHASVAHVEDKAEPLFPGTFSEFVKERTRGNEALATQLRNVVRACKHCGKSNGFTMTECNGCNMPIPDDQPRTHTDNLFMGFIYGVERTDKITLTVSIRRQTDQLLVFDDPLALTPCHLNVIPTTAWIPDWRFLLRNPLEGLRLIETLEAAAWDCVKTQFLTDDVWCSKFLRCGRPANPDDLREHIICGCNFPPSQFQLHVQYFLMPWLPNQYRAFLDGNQMVQGRWFPMSYMKRVLALNDPFPVTMETPLTDIFAKYDARVSYEAAWREEGGIPGAHVSACHAALANWQPSDFSLQVAEGKVRGGDAAGRNGLQVIADDKKAMQSTCPPGTKTYYRHARSMPVPEWGSDALVQLQKRDL